MVRRVYRHIYRLVEVFAFIVLFLSAGRCEVRLKPDLAGRSALARTSSRKLAEA